MVGSLLGADMASGRTLCAIHRSRGWPDPDVKQMAARSKEEDTEVTFTGAQRAQPKYHKPRQGKSGSGSEKCPRRASSKCNMGCLAETPTHCPYLHGPCFHRLSSKTHHQQPSNQTCVLFIKGPQKCSTNKTDFERPPGGLKQLRPFIQKTEMIQPMTVLGRIICCRPGRKSRSPCTPATTAALPLPLLLLYNNNYYCFHRHQ